MTPELRYQVELDLPAHEFVVRLSLEGDFPEGVDLRLPAWIPGSYMIRDFARNITAISASAAAGVLRLGKADKQTWQVPPCSGPLQIDYRVYAFDLSVRSAYLDDTRAYFNGTSLFILPVGLDQGTWQVMLSAPADGGTESWCVHTSMPAQAVDARGFGLYQGSGYASLIDHPVEIGVTENAVFEVAGRRHEIAVSDGGTFEAARIGRDLSIICREHAAMFGELPVDAYLFLVLATADGYGGLEHLDSTSLICKRSDLPRHGLGVPDKGYRQFLGLCSHEYFHLWNVKRIRPARLAAADLAAETHTELLWAFEGITSYYDDLALVRSGVISTEDYLGLLAAIVTRVMRGPGRLRQSVAESSFDAWTRFYKQDENAPNAIVSYYAKGALIAFGLDVTLRRLSEGRLSLDDLMRALWVRHGRSGIGVPERGIEDIVTDLLGQRLDNFFEAYVYGTAELPLHDWFAALGIGMRLRAAEGQDDQGGCRREPPEAPPAAGFAARHEERPEGLRLVAVTAGGAAYAAGLCAGDCLLAIDGERVTAAKLPDLLVRARDGVVDVSYFRRDRLHTARVTLQPAATDTCDLWLLADDETGPDALQRRGTWLRSNASRDA